MVGNLKPEILPNIISCVDITLQSCHAANCFPAIISLLHSTGLLPKLIQHLWEKKEMRHILVSYLNLFSRICILDVDICLTYLQEQGGDDMIGFMIDTWTEKVLFLFFF